MRHVRLGPLGLIVVVGLTASACASAGARDSVVPESASIKADGEPSPTAPDPATSPSVQSPLSESTIKFLKRHGVRVELTDPDVENPRKRMAEVVGPRPEVPEHELRVWEVSLVRATAANPCKVGRGGCKPTVDDRLTYVVFRQSWGPEFPHSQPCCNPRPFSKEPRLTTSWSIYDANTGKHLSGARLG